MLRTSFSLLFLLVSVVAGHAIDSRYYHRYPSAQHDLAVLLKGNEAFRDKIEASSEPDLLEDLRKNGQHPPFTYFGCSDSRVSEGTIFDAKPGTLFTHRSIANQFHSSDTAALSVLSYGISHLGVRQIIVMGHYGCGGVAAAIASPPSTTVDAADGSVQAWIEPIRKLYQTSTRQEIIDLRQRNGNRTDVPEPDYYDPGFRALVEENVKAGVKTIAESSVIRNWYLKLSGGGETGSAHSKRAEHKAPQPVSIHGFVYDLESGAVTDLGVSVHPPSH